MNEQREMRPGYYVNDVWYGERIAQARARARHLANELSGAVEVIYQSEDGELRIVSIHTPGNNDLVQTPQPKIYKPAFEANNPGDTKVIGRTKNRTEY